MLGTCISLPFPLDPIENGLTGRSWAQIIIIGLGCSICSIAVVLWYRVLIRTSRLTWIHHAIASLSLPITACLVIAVIESTIVYPAPFALIVAASSDLRCNGGP